MSQSGFTIAELMISLGIMALLSMFTVPKLQAAWIAQQNTRNNEIMRDSVALMHSAMVRYRLDHDITADTSFYDFLPYMNYTKMLTSGETVDQDHSQTGNWICGTWNPCFVLQSGAILQVYYGDGTLSTGNQFGGTGSNYYVWVKIDPDGELTSPTTTNGPGKSMNFAVYTDGKVKVHADCEAGDMTRQNNVMENWCPGDQNFIPDWYTWD
ncbi:MAG: type II secretion system protein [Candidatus Melainabacteria bacterium]